MLLLKELEKEIKTNEMRIAKDKEELLGLDKGNIEIECKRANEKEYYSFRYVGNGKTHYIKKGSPIIHNLIRKRFLESEIEILAQNNIALKKMLNDYTEVSMSEIIAGMPKHFSKMSTELFLPLNSVTLRRGSNNQSLICMTSSGKYQIMNGNRMKPGEELIKQTRPKGKILDSADPGFEKARQAWALEPYLKSNYYPENLKQPISAGFNVRTKAEALIAERFIAHKVPFRYEEPIFISGKEFPRYPDFKSIDICGEEVFWEHGGLMDNEEYVRKHKLKLEEYESIGIVPWKNLIITYDNPDGSLDIRMIDAIIKTRFIK